jgi:hypothetical protein
MGDWRYSATIPVLGTRWRVVVIFMPRPLYPQKKSPRNPLYRRLGGPHSRCESCGEETISCPCQESNPNSSDVQPAAVSLSRLHFLYKTIDTVLVPSDKLLRRMAVSLSLPTNGVNCLYCPSPTLCYHPPLGLSQTSGTYQPADVPYS